MHGIGRRADFRVVLDLDSSGNPVGIEVRDQSGSVDTTATNALQQSCNTNIAEATLQSDSADATPDVYEVEAINLALDDASSFSVGDVVTIVDSTGDVVDFDSNVIAQIVDNKITLKRRLGHDYQTSIDLTSDTYKVRRSIVSASDTFYNYREGSFIRMLEVDLQGLLTCVDSNGNALAQNLMDSGKELDDDTDDGLVWFFTVDGPNSNVDINEGDASNNYGIRFRNGGSGWIHPWCLLILVIQPDLFLALRV